MKSAAFSISVSTSRISALNHGVYYDSLRSCPRLQSSERKSSRSFSTVPNQRFFVVVSESESPVPSKSPVSAPRNVKVAFSLGVEGNKETRQQNIWLRDGNNDAFVVSLAKPLGIIFEESEDKTDIIVKELVPDGNAAKSKNVFVGDRLAATTASAYNVKDTNPLGPQLETILFTAQGEKFDKVMTAIKSNSSSQVTLILERKRS
mmetsp:Transcript_7833/g.12532  ORF Transcript_7833/g.12532 Transcript_7833/m.12532 type:complete len:205 (+) Transcript_7833:102-716(+)